MTMKSVSNTAFQQQHFISHRSQSGTFVRRDSDFYGRFGSGNMPDFREAVKERLAKTRDEMPQGLMREVLETYKPHILGRRRRLIEDCVRDLRLNNDHIHIIEQAMRRSIEVLTFFSSFY